MGPDRRGETRERAIAFVFSAPGSPLPALGIKLNRFIQLNPEQRVIADQLLILGFYWEDALYPAMIWTLQQDSSESKLICINLRRSGTPGP